MKSPLFVFLGVTESGTDANIGILKIRLETALSKYSGQARFDEKGDLLIITISQPHFCFYISFVTNDHKTVADWKELAKNCELPWDIKLVDKARLADIYAYLEANAWPEHGPTLKLGFTILEEIERFNGVKVFTIPSLGKTTFWGRIFKG